MTILALPALALSLMLHFGVFEIVGVYSLRGLPSPSYFARRCARSLDEFWDTEEDRKEAR